jgi:hypothetical protein
MNTPVIYFGNHGKESTPGGGIKEFDPDQVFVNRVGI